MKLSGSEGVTGGRSGREASDYGGQPPRAASHVLSTTCASQLPTPSASGRTSIHTSTCRSSLLRIVISRSIANQSSFAFRIREKSASAIPARSCAFLQAAKRRHK